MSGVWNVILGGDTVLGVFGSALYFEAREHMAKLDSSGAACARMPGSGGEP